MFFLKAKSDKLTLPKFRQKMILKSIYDILLKKIVNRL